MTKDGGADDEGTGGPLTFMAVLDAGVMLTSH